MSEPDSDVDVVAAEAVRLLDVRDFIDHNLDSLGVKLEEANRTAGTRDKESDARFAALSLAAVAMVIEYFSNKKDMAAAEAWVREYWGAETPGRDTKTILTALTLIYVVQQGAKRYADDPERGATWQEITARLAAIKEQARSSRAKQTEGA